jgi:hypothetical protein
MKRILLLISIICLMATPVFAANKVYVAKETAVTFNDTTSATTLTLNDLGDNEAQVSDRADLGAGSTSEWFNIRAVIQWDVAPIEGETCDIYISTSDGTDSDGNVGTTTAAVTDLDTLDNMIFAGSVKAESASADVDFIASFIVRITTRYYSVVVHNNAQTAGDNLQATNDISYVIVTPIPPEIQ